MATLSTEARKRLPDSDFAGPGRSYPVSDASHAANAKARATQQVKAGNLSPSAAAKIKARANVALGHHHHALSMASATHLRNQGYMTAEHAEAVHRDARGKMAMMKGQPMKDAPEERREPRAERKKEGRPYGSPAAGY